MKLRFSTLMAAFVMLGVNVAPPLAAFASQSGSSASLAQASPAPAASASPASGAPETGTIPTPAPRASQTPQAVTTPSGFSYRGYVRAYNFTRDNGSNNLQGGAATAVDQRSFSPALSLHAEDAFYGGLSAGASYVFSYPFNDHCSHLAQHYVGSPCVTQRSPGLRPDDSLPGFELSALYEAYIAYADKSLTVKIGDQLYTTPWANPADSRLKPAAYQGADVTYKLDKHFSVQFSDILRFGNRTSNVFDRSTLLTSFTPVTGLGGSVSVPANIYDPLGVTLQTNGFYYGRIGYTYGPANRLTANVSDYNFQNIANAGWADARYQIYPASRFKPFIALQGGIEKNAGHAIVGKIDSSVVGAQAGIFLSPRVQLTAAYDSIPVRVDRAVDLTGTGLTCSSAGHTIGLRKGVAAATASLPYFLPSGGTANCTANAGGTADIYYGGWASPYTFSYATDPLFTTSLTQGMVDRGSPGNAFKFQMTYTTIDKRLATYISFGSYRYTNPGYAQFTGEADFDVSYFLKRPPALGAYKGLSLRYRYGDRYQTGTAAHGGSPDFRYNRAQLQYDF